VFERENPGFDAVVGNPPWNEVKVERTFFFIPHDPGLGSIRSSAQRDARVAALTSRFPYLQQEFEAAIAEADRLRDYFRSADGDYELQGRGDLDLYELFFERYGTLLRNRGGLGVVLPRSALYVDGAVALRRWAFRNMQVQTIDVLLNDRRWAFDMEPRYTVALVVALRADPGDEDQLVLTGPHRNREQFDQRQPVPVARAALARWTRPSGGRGEPSWEVPLLPSAPARDLWDRLMEFPRFDEGRAGEWRAFAATDFHVTNDRAYIRDHGDWEVWTGGTFEQFTPWSGDVAGYCDSSDGCERLQRKRQRSAVWRQEWPEAIHEPDTLAPRTFRIAFRGIARATDSQTVIACLLPPHCFLTNAAPYLVMPNASPVAQAYVLGVLNSLVFNWQARRLAEININFFVLYFLRMPDLSLADGRATRIAELAARLNAINDRYTSWSDRVGVAPSVMTDDQRLAQRAELEAEVAGAYGVAEDDLEVIFSDFTERALSSELRSAVRAML
jgi:hypothetical protein